ncbi:MAG TPA: MFS transporter [Stellaceae bacterium]|nr:MFS transporter [Stellaceae bacterium]
MTAGIPAPPLAAAAEHRSFAALRHPGFRAYFIGGWVAMMADNVEHVISYWIVYQKFHSPALLGFAVVSHWLPFLLFAVYSGALADRFDPRRIIQCGMLIFMLCSAAWGFFFLTDTLTPWEAAGILVFHGFAGVLWIPSSMLLIHDIVGPADLQSAVRLNATGIWLGRLCGPIMGSALLLGLGPIAGIFANILIYLPLTLWLWKAPYGPRFRTGQHASPRAALRGMADILATWRAIVARPTIVLMTALAGGAALLVGNAYQAQMPGFAQDFGHGNAGLYYSLLLGADAAGALTAGIALESFGLLRAHTRTALVLGGAWCVAICGFALAPAYPLALAFLFAAGFVELSFNAMAQTLVQMHAPADIRGRVIGFFNMFANGARAFSGVTVGFGGALIGIHASLALSATALLVLLMSLLAWARRVAHHATPGG